jgi:hypothetical protein
MLYVKRHLSIILIVLLTLAAITLVLWIFNRRLERLDARPKTIEAYSFFHQRRKTHPVVYPP